MINMDTEKDYGEAHLNPLQRQNMRIFIEATKSLMDSVGEEGLSIRKIAAKGCHCCGWRRETAVVEALNRPRTIFLPNIR